MVLYINTSDQKIIKVALKKEGEMVESMEEENEYGSQVLLPLIVKLLKSSQKLDFKNLTGIEVDLGPGSFTGIRVGVSVAQALGFALKIPVNGEMGKPLQLEYT